MNDKLGVNDKVEFAVNRGRELSEGIKVTGHVKYEVLRSNGDIEVIEYDNLVVTAGKTALATLLSGAGAGNTWAPYMGFGTSTVAAAAGDTALGTELTTATYTGYARKSNTITNPSAGQVQFQASITGGAATISEAGLFSASTVGTLVAHQVFTGVPLASSDTLQVTWTITFS